MNCTRMPAALRAWLRIASIRRVVRMPRAVNPGAGCVFPHSGPTDGLATCHRNLTVLPGSGPASCLAAQWSSQTSTTLSGGTTTLVATTLMVRLVFRPYTQVRKAICTSAHLRASTRVSSGFALLRHSSPSFGSQQVCSYSNLSQKIMGGR